MFLPLPRPIVSALLVAARGPFQIAAMAYIGAAGLAGTAVVTGVMLTPARQVVEEAITPAAELVQSLVPQTVAFPALFEVVPAPVSVAKPGLSQPPAQTP